MRHKSHNVHRKLLVCRTSIICMLCLHNINVMLQGKNVLSGICVHAATLSDLYSMDAHMQAQRHHHHHHQVNKMRFMRTISFY